jgi:DNA-binding transcriptional LysR family regulator
MACSIRFDRTIAVTFEQLAIFVAVAEREHLTRAASAIGLTPSAVSAAIRNLESFYGVELFHRVGRRIELTRAGRAFLGEAQATLARVRAAELALSELGGLTRGTLDLYASQTIASYWLPPRLMHFHEAHPGIELRLTVGNTRRVAEAVREGLAEVGFIEGVVDEPVLSSQAVARDQMVVVAAPGHPLATRRRVTAADLVSATQWVMREPGSGTRSEFESALRGLGADPAALQVALVLPSNEAVLSAVRAGASAAAAVSSAAVAPFIARGDLKVVDFALPARPFFLLRHRERHRSQAAEALEAICGLRERRSTGRKA